MHKKISRSPSILCLCLQFNFSSYQFIHVIFGVVTLSLSLAESAGVCEGAGSFAVSVKLKTDIERDVEATVETSDLSAKGKVQIATEEICPEYIPSIAPDDYKELVHTFQFNAPLSADTVMTTDVTISDDQDLEPCEDFTVTLTSSSERAAISGASSRRVVIYDDEGRGWC